VSKVISLFNPSRWVAEWETIGGYILLGEGHFAADGSREAGMAEWMLDPLHRAPTERAKIEVLRRQVSEPDARMRVIDFLARRAATRGW